MDAGFRFGYQLFFQTPPALYIVADLVPENPVSPGFESFGKGLGFIFLQYRQAGLLGNIFGIFLPDSSQCKELKPFK